MVPEDPGFDSFSRKGEGNLYDPTVMPGYSVSQIGYVFNHQFELVMIGVGMADETFWRIFHEGFFVTGSPLTGKTLFLDRVNEIILSTANPKVKELVRLRQSSGKRRDLGLFVAEGVTEVDALFRSGRRIREIYFCESFAGGAKGPEFLESWKESGCSVTELGSEAFAKASYKNNSDGVLAIVESWVLDLPSVPQSSRVALVLDGIEKPGNLGAILRTAEAFGASNVLLSEPVLDFFNPNVVRSSRGLMASLRVSAGTKNEVYSWLEEEGLRLVGTSAKSSKSYWDLELCVGTAFVLGSEKEGLGEFWKERIAEWACIPMAGEASSLNLNVSAACLLAEFNRSVT
jgi:TrmH family RNA methyltransferase